MGRHHVPAVHCSMLCKTKGSSIWPYLLYDDAHDDAHAPRYKLSVLSAAANWQRPICQHCDSAQQWLLDGRSHASGLHSGAACSAPAQHGMVLWTHVAIMVGYTAQQCGPVVHAPATYTCCHTFIWMLHILCGSLPTYLTPLSTPDQPALGRERWRMLAHLCQHASLIVPERAVPACIYELLRYVSMHDASMPARAVSTLVAHQ